MGTLPSSEFRKTFARLRETTVVQVNGRTLGTWAPGESMGLVSNAEARIAELEAEVRHLEAELAKRPGPASHRVEAGSSFNSRPFTPVPKFGK